VNAIIYSLTHLGSTAYSTTSLGVARWRYRVNFDVTYDDGCRVDCSSVSASGMPICVAGASSIAGCGLVQPVTDATLFPEIIKDGVYTTSEALSFMRRVCVDVTVDVCRATLAKYRDYKYSVPDWFAGADVFFQERYK